MADGALGLLAGGEPLRAEIRSVLAGGHDPGPSGYDPGMWRELGGRGWLALGGPAAAGGHGRLADLTVLLEELGRAPVPTPVQNGVVQAVTAVAAAGGRVLDGALDGTVRLALCLTGPGGVTAPGRLGVTCRAEAGALVLDGTSRYVPYADSADVLVVAADGPGDGVSLATVPAAAAGVTCAPAPSVAGDRQAEVRFDRVSGTPVGPPGGAWPAVERTLLIGAFGLCAEVVGASAALIERTVAHASERVQFGAPIGSLQAVQHRCADMVLDHLAAAGAVDEAVRCLDAGRPAVVEVAAAKSLCGTACARVAASAHRLWGGTGYLADSGLHRWTRLIMGAGALLGRPLDHRRRLVEELRASGAWSTHAP